MTGRQRPRARSRAEDQKRQRVTFEAARIMAEEGVRDFQTAKRKAAERLNLADNRYLPRNEEIQAALEERLRLFHGERLARDLRRLRELALEAMRFLAPFEPRLVGPVLIGAVTPESEIQLHVAADTPEQVGLHLQEHRIPYEQGERRMRFGGDRQEVLPTYRLIAGDAAVELSVFDVRAIREPPLSPVDGRPMKRASVRELEAMLYESD
ncbi:hypothetical protein SVA_0047 [Sulfurifustis variabilis]|uniref:Nucleotidyltransferase n=1 Tax=Sulfurifustis variabilis TaxID=1675686 RepID=A0A1B4UZQ4_9GAMM|nr:hypothetical protein [Sulfurifustis variabilis]BAU46629.1 hypothetical protein SVA_0047 [Sulfurifustis variabilis]